MCRSRFLCLRDLEPLADRLRGHPRVLDPSVPLGDRVEQLEHVDVLMRLLVNE